MERLNTSKLLKLTHDSFTRMNDNVLSNVNDSELNFDSVIPYLLSRGIYTITGKTLVPELILNTIMLKQHGNIDKLVRIDSVLDKKTIAAINFIINNRPTRY